MSRSLKKVPYTEPSLIAKVQKVKETKDRKPIKTWSRRSVIIPDFIGVVIAIHDGRKHVPVLISEEMVGRKLGELVLTRTFRGHAAKGKVAKSMGTTGRVAS